MKVINFFGVRMYAILLVLVTFVINSNAYAQSCEAFAQPTGQFAIELENVTPIANSVDRPVSMVQPPNDPSKWYVIDQEGTVTAFQNGKTFTKLNTVLDITDRVTREFDGRSWNEMGLLSISFHPDFATNGYVYLYYSAVGPNATTPLYARLSRFTSFDNGLTLDPDSEEVVLQLDRDAVFHWGGQQFFNPNDGYFHMSIGDGGRRSKSQDYFDLNGSFIRLDLGNGQLPYSIPPDNPFVSGGARPEIFAKGLRNPWRWSIDVDTDRIFLGDVGKSDAEEVNFIEAGKNYGWPIREGAECFEPATGCRSADLTPPIIQYPHDSTGGVAIVGGYVYRGSLIPSLVGHYIYADTLGRIWSFDSTNLNNVTPRVIFEDPPFKYSFAEGLDKELYLLKEDGIDRLVQPSGTVTEIPALLSETGCFTSTSPLVPASNLTRYEVNTPLWSDGALKDRWMNIPANEPIIVNEEHDWEYPVGTVMVKNFSLGTQLIETRLFMRHDDGEWAGYTYAWNNAQTEAEIVPAAGSVRQVGAQTWNYPSRVQCLQCHTSSGGFVLGPETAQLNREILDSNTGETINQLVHLKQQYDIQNLDVSDTTTLPLLASIDDPSQTAQWKSRSYLHANCAMCHQPGGPGRGPEDFRYFLPDDEIGAIDVDPQVDDLGIAGSKLILPGNSDLSVMSLRMHSLDPTIRMPQIGTTIVDTQATQVIDQWIDSMDDKPATLINVCGAPTITPQDAGIYLWQDCGTGVWRVITAAAGDDVKRYIGRISSDEPLSLVSTSLSDSQDEVALFLNDRELRFDLNAAAGQLDFFNFTLEPNSNTCLVFDFPVNTQIRLGREAFEVTSNAFNLTTFEPCSVGTIEVVGAPDIDQANSAPGVYAWQEVNGDWTVQLIAGNSTDIVSATGSITSTTEITSVTGISIESNDILDTPDSNTIEFGLNARSPSRDGFEFSTVANANQCISINLSSLDVDLFVGPQAAKVTTPFNLTQLPSCSTTTPIPPKPPRVPRIPNGFVLIAPIIDLLLSE